jgi:hypothetical protein
MNTNQNNVDIGFCFSWVLASTLGFGVGAVLGIVILVAAHVPDSLAFTILFGGVFG